MMEKSKIYTRSGDKGLTSLVGGKRVIKTNNRLEAYGTVDELNAFIGLLIEALDDKHDRETLLQIQNYLFSVGCLLATEAGANTPCAIEQAAIDLLEHEIDSIDASLPSLNSFVLPGGSKASSIAHICRTVCRRAERCIYKVNEQEEVNYLILNFINRLSDYFFVLARKTCFAENGQEIIWKNSCK